MLKGKIEVKVPLDLARIVDTFLEVAKDDPSLPQFKDRDALTEYVVNCFLSQHRSIRDG